MKIRLKLPKFWAARRGRCSQPSQLERARKHLLQKLRRGCLLTGLPNSMRREGDSLAPVLQFARQVQQSSAQDAFGPDQDPDLLGSGLAQPLSQVALTPPRGAFTELLSASDTVGLSLTSAPISAPMSM